MPRLVVGYTEIVGGKLKNWNGFLEPNFGVGANCSPHDSTDELLVRHPQVLRERGMRKFKSVGQAQRFQGAHAAVSKFFNVGRHPGLASKTAKD